MNFFGVNIPDPTPGTPFAQEFNKALNSAQTQKKANEYVRPAEVVVPQNTTSAQQVSNNTMTPINELADFAQSYNDYASQFNSAEAERNRSWQEYMSNTAHQREVEDLKKAGLNPVLSVGGNGAGFGSVGNASYENASNSLIGFASQLINAETSLKSAQIMANAQLGSAAMSAGASRYATDLYNQTNARNNTNSNLSHLLSVGLGAGLSLLTKSPGPLLSSIVKQGNTTYYNY